MNPFAYDLHTSATNRTPTDSEKKYESRRLGREAGSGTPGLSMTERNRSLHDFDKGGYGSGNYGRYDGGVNQSLNLDHMYRGNGHAPSSGIGGGSQAPVFMVPMTIAGNYGLQPGVNQSMNFNPAGNNYSHNSYQNRADPLRGEDRNDGKYKPTGPSSLLHNRPELSRFEEKENPYPVKMSVEEFERLARPRMEMRKIIRIQALIRGWYTRKVVIPRIRLNHQVAYNVMEDYLEEFIEEKFLPEILLDIIRKSKYDHDFTLYSEEQRVYLAAYDMVAMPVIKELCREVAKEINNMIVNEYLRERYKQKSIYENDPLHMVAQDMLNSVQDKILADVAKESIDSMIGEYLEEAQMMNYLRNVFLPAYCYDLANDMVAEYAIEMILDDMLGQLSKEASELTAVRALEDAKEEAEEETFDRHFTSFMERMILQIAVDNFSVVEQYKETEGREQLEAEREKKREEQAELERSRMSENLNKFDDLRNFQNGEVELESAFAKFEKKRNQKTIMEYMHSKFK